MPEPRFAELDSSERFESGWNRLQLFVEVLVGLVVLAGLAGLFGTGPLSSRVVAFDKAAMTMTYERILRRTVVSQLTVRTTAPLPGDRLEVELPTALADDMDVVSTSPRSTLMRAEPEGVVYVFALGTARLGTVSFSMKPRTPGLIRSVVRSGDAQAELRQIVLP